jgi:hypothetical protein
MYLEEAKRIGQRLLSTIDADAVPIGFRILSQDNGVVYDLHVSQDDQTSHE